MKLTKTQKNFKRQMRNVKIDDMPNSYLSRHKTVSFREEYEEPKKKRNPLVTIFKIIFYWFIFPRILGYLIQFLYLKKDVFRVLIENLESLLSQGL